MSCPLAHTHTDGGNHHSAGHRTGGRWLGAPCCCCSPSTRSPTSSGRRAEGSARCCCRCGPGLGARSGLCCSGKMGSQCVGALRGQPWSRSRSRTGGRTTRCGVACVCVGECWRGLRGRVAWVGVAARRSASDADAVGQSRELGRRCARGWRGGESSRERGQRWRGARAGGAGPSVE